MDAKALISELKWQLILIRQAERAVGRDGTAGTPADATVKHGLALNDFIHNKLMPALQKGEEAEAAMKTVTARIEAVVASIGP